MRSLVLLAALVVAPGAAAQDVFDIFTWHEGHPVARAEEEAPDRRLRLGLYPRAGAAIGTPNGIAGLLQCSLSLHRPDRFSLYVGGGYEVGPAVEGPNITIGWGSVRRAPARAPQRGFSGAFLRYRRIDSDEHGEHDGLSVGVESGIGAFGATLEIGAARSDANHWIPVARLMFTVGHSWLWTV
jgi:hypothetical protein